MTAINGIFLLWCKLANPVFYLCRENASASQFNRRLYPTIMGYGQWFDPLPASPVSYPCILTSICKQDCTYDCGIRTFSIIVGIRVYYGQNVSKLTCYISIIPTS